jgi:transcriptional regulator with XRE-family HTH domain
VPARRIHLGTDALSRGLARLRDNAGLSGAQAAQRAGAGFSQSKISRWEAGKLIPNPDDVDHYAQALGAPAAERRRLVAHARDLHDQHKVAAPARITLRRAASYQQRVGRIEADSTHIATFHPLLIPGLLQTAEYMRALFGSRLTGNALDQAVTARLNRQTLLDDTSRTFTMILTHGALGWRGGSPDTMAAQTEHIITHSRRPNLHIGIIPWGTQATAFPVDGFNIYDERLVIVGTTTATAHITDPRDIAQYTTLLAELTTMATFGDPARTILTEIATTYR